MTDDLTPTEPTLWGRQPVYILAVIQAALALAVGFGLQLSGDQVALVMALSTAVIALITNRHVTPNAWLKD
ncbi:hypothetical protein KGQ64_10085 [bacterium]|nr:hypothetical protein [bacterium]